jgi:hypothetical protein
VRTSSKAVVTSLVMLVCHSAGAAPSFEGGWESGTVIGSGSTNWRSLEVVAPDRFTLLNDGIRPGTYARVEVRNGDNPLTFCCDGSDRAEVATMQNADNTRLDENLSSGTQQFSFSVKFDSGWQDIVAPGAGAFGIFLQLHGPNQFAASPALAFSATDQIRFNMLVGDLDASSGVGNSLSHGSLNKGQWIDFVLTVKFAADNSGAVNILRRDEGDSIFTEVLNIEDTPTLQYSSSFSDGAVLDHYWKHGLYRNRQDFTSVLYLDGMTRQVSPVPEPGSTAMLFAGMGLLGLAARRRNLIGSQRGRATRSSWVVEPT